MENDQLKQLIILSQNGDKKSYHKLLESIQEMASQTVKRKVFKPQDRDDVIQNCLLAIHKSLHTYDPSRPATSWVKSIIHYKIIDYIRSYVRLAQRELHLDQTQDVTIGEEETNYKQMEGLEILNQLPESLRKPLILTKVDGLSTKEASQKMGIKENALRTRISRGLSQLKKLNESMD